MPDEMDLYPDGVPDTPSQPPPRTKQPGLDVQDRRRPERIVVPFYVVESYGASIGPYGLALYLVLCYHVGRVRAAWPTMNRLAALCGCSRSSIERAMRELKAADLVRVDPCIDSRGQRSNTIYLVDPGSPSTDRVSRGPTASIPPRPPEGPPLPNDSAGAVDLKGYAPSNGRRVPYEEDSIGRESAPPLQTEPPQNAREARQLQDCWMRQLLCSSAPMRAQHKAEILPILSDLLRRGYAADHLEREIESDGRDTAEWPRLFRERIIRARASARPKTGYRPTEERLASTADSAAKNEERVNFRKFAAAAKARMARIGVNPSTLFVPPAEEAEGY